MRIDKFLCNAGIATRSQIKDDFKKGRVNINGNIVRSAKTQIDPKKDIIKFNDVVIEYKPYYYFVLNKPKGYVSANIDNIYPTVLEFFNDLNIKNLTHVGRLDLDTTGVLLITNDGKINHALINPKNNIEKIYIAKLDKSVKQDNLAKLKSGIILENKEQCKPARTEIIDENTIKIYLTEGKYHQVKRMMRAIGYEVIELNRISFAGLTTKDVNQGEYYELNEEEIQGLYKLIS